MPNGLSTQLSAEYPNLEITIKDMNFIDQCGLTRKPCLALVRVRGGNNTQEDGQPVIEAFEPIPPFSCRNGCSVPTTSQ